ncbi:MAG: nitrate/sulfonate/bicarbonate ABC transporter ATP-binding protein [Oligoflexia bacterium]|nr:nitrate/sulfonate/bicarbonate ABC transporter ATP-binding protein [Oligoflexia bacterium]
MSEQKPLVEMKSVKMSYRLSSGTSVSVLEDFNLTLHPGEIVALLGASGAGKSTTLKLMSGLLRSEAGEIYSNGQKLEGLNRELSIVFQESSLFPWLTVAENIEFGLFPQGYSLRTRRQRVSEAIDLVGLEGFEEAYPRELSGGMKQRVAIARALAMNPKVLGMDEPFSALDVLTADTLRGEVLEIWQRKTSKLKGILFITHDIVEAVSMANRIIVLGAPPKNVKADILNPLAFPRDENSWQFNQLVRKIHSVLSDSILGDDDNSNAQNQAALWVLPPVPIADVIGLTELLVDYKGQLDIFELPRLIEKDFSEALTAVKAAELIGFVDTPYQKVILTRLGQGIAHGDVNQRKEAINTQLKSLRIVKMVIELLQNQEEVALPYSKMIEWLQEKQPAVNAQSALDTLIDWGRYGGLFRYNSDEEMLSLEEDHPTVL